MMVMKLLIALMGKVVSNIASILGFEISSDKTVSTRVTFHYATVLHALVIITFTLGIITGGCGAKLM